MLGYCSFNGVRDSQSLSVSLLQLYLLSEPTLRRRDLVFDHGRIITQEPHSKKFVPNLAAAYMVLSLTSRKHAPGCGCRSHSPHSHRFRTEKCPTVGVFGGNRPRSVMKWSGLENDPGISPFSRPGAKNVHRRHPCRIRGLPPDPPRGRNCYFRPALRGDKVSWSVGIEKKKREEKKNNTGFPKCPAPCGGGSGLGTGSQ